MSRVFTMIALIFALGFGMAGCAGKKPAGAAAGTAQPSVTESTVSESGTTSKDVGTSAMPALTMPVIHFDYNESLIREDDRPKLHGAADQLKKLKDMRITIEGHCDERGSSEYNLALGERRAAAVKSYLQKLGVDGSRVSTISYGKERPVDQGHDEGAWAKNRRGEIVSSQ